MDAPLLVHGHLVILQVVVNVLSLQLPLQQSMAQQILVAHSVGGNGFQPLEEVVGFRMSPRDLLERMLAKQSVIAVVA